MLTNLLTRRSGERTTQDSTGQDGETAKVLLRHTSADSRLRDRKGTERLRAQCPAPEVTVAARRIRPNGARSTAVRWQLLPEDPVTEY